jgi:hypothetical protein
VATNISTHSSSRIECGLPRNLDFRRAFQHGNKEPACVLQVGIYPQTARNNLVGLSPNPVQARTISGARAPLRPRAANVPVSSSP